MIKITNEELELLKNAYSKVKKGFLASERMIIVSEETGLPYEKVIAYLSNQYDYAEPEVTETILMTITYEASIKVRYNREEYSSDEIVEEVKDRLGIDFSIDGNPTIEEYSDELINGIALDMKPSDVHFTKDDLYE